MEMPPRMVRAILTCSLTWPLWTGCIRPDARPDYRRASALISQRTGAEAYDPTADESATQRVDELLQGDLSVAQAVQIALLNNPSFQSLMADIGHERLKAGVIQKGDLHRLRDGQIALKKFINALRCRFVGRWIVGFGAGALRNERARAAIIRPRIGPDAPCPERPGERTGQNSAHHARRHFHWNLVVSRSRS